MVDLKTVKVGQKLYCSQINECCEGWESTSFHKTEVTAIKENKTGNVIEFNNNVSPVISPLTVHTLSTLNIQCQIYLFYCLDCI